MSSIAMFPRKFTDGDEIIRRLSEKLQLRICTDKDLAKETAETFGGDTKKT